MDEIQKFPCDLFRINDKNYAKYEMHQINIKRSRAKKQNLKCQFFIVQRLSLILKNPFLPIIRAQVDEIAQNFLTRPSEPSRTSVQNFRTLALLEVLFLKFHAAAAATAAASPQQ